MGSALTHLYFLINPKQLEIVEAEGEEEKAYVGKFRLFREQSPFREIQEMADLEIEEIIRYGILMDTFNFDPKQK